MKFMKFFASIILSIFLISQSYAGLFDYTQWEKTRINSTSQESVDVIRQLHVPVDFTYNTHRVGISNTQYSTCQNWEIWKIRLGCNFYPRQNVAHRVSWNYYVRQDLINILRNELQEIEYQQDYVTETMRDIKRDLRNAKRYTTSYYRSVTQRLEDELDFFEDAKDNLKEREDVLEDELRKVRNSSSTSRSYYFDYYGYNNNYYYDRSHIHYQREPTWLNENLTPRDEWYIYIQ